MDIAARYEKNIGTIGIEGQKRLFESHVAIVGAGGLGGCVFEILVRYGVGAITIVDFDSFDETNLNRQLLSSIDVVGKNKADVAKARAEKINPDVKVNAVSKRISDENAKKILSDAHLICDCLGNICDRFVLERAARDLKIPMVHAAIAGQQGQIMTIFPDSNGLEAIYGAEEDAPSSGKETELGTPPSTVMAIASLQAHEAIGALIEKDAGLRDILVSVDLNSWKIDRFRVFRE